MKFRQPMRTNNRKMIVLVAMASLLGGALTQATVVYLEENFQEATLGGTATPPSGSPNTTGVSPTVGSLVYLQGEEWKIVSGIKSSQGMAALPNEADGPVGYLDLAPNVKPNSGVFETDFEFHDVNNAGAQIMIFYLYNSDWSQAANLYWQQSASGDTFTLLGPAGAGLPSIASEMVNDVPYQLQFGFNLTSGAWNAMVIDLNNDTVVGSYQDATGLGITGGPVGLFGLNPQTFFTDPGSDSSVLLDNILVVDQIPEPSTILLFGCGAGLLWLWRRMCQAAA